MLVALRALLIVAAALLSAGEAALAQSARPLTLVRERSQVTFTIRSALQPLSGTIERYSGQLVDPESPSARMSLALSCDLASIKLSGEQMSYLPVSELLQSARSGAVTFSGEASTSARTGRVDFRGTLRWRGKVYEAVIPVQIRRSRGSISLDGSVTGSGAELTENFPVLSMFQVSAAEARAALYFQRNR
jgi:polyisoprenoid-binding protein YceI